MIGRPVLPGRPGRLRSRPVASLPALVALAVLAGIAGFDASGAWAQTTADSLENDPVMARLHRMDKFLHSQEVDGVTRDPRSLGNPAEEIRLTVVPQVLGYCELYRTFPNPVHYRDIVDRADYLLRHFDEASAGTASDGMLGSAFLCAWEVTGDPRYRSAAQPIVDRALALGGFQARLNWGLMAAMALADYARLTGDGAAAQKVREIVQGVVLEQAWDGSFPHYCPSARDIHYTAWMSMEMSLIGRTIADPVLENSLQRAHQFLRGRIDTQGMTHYQEDIGAGLVETFYSLGAGCGVDYDTRGWINELGYLALLFGNRTDPLFDPVMLRLRALEDRGAYADKWDYFPVLSDPIYPWATARRSVIRTSVIFWSLACLHSDQVKATAKASPKTASTATQATAAPGTELSLSGGDPYSTVVPAAAGEGPLFQGVAPNPAARECWIGFRASEPGAARIEIFDAAGRRVRTLGPVEVAVGGSRMHWDGRDDHGARAGRGLYFARVVLAGGTTQARIVLTD